MDKEATQAIGASAKRGAHLVKELMGLLDGGEGFHVETLVARALVDIRTFGAVADVDTENVAAQMARFVDEFGG